MQGIYRLDVDCWRMWRIHWIFIEDDKRVSTLINSWIEVSFWEILWKHSDMQFAIDWDDIQLLTTDGDAISMFEKYDMDTWYNPFDECKWRVPEDIEEDVEDIDYVWEVVDYMIENNLYQIAPWQ